MIRFIIKRTFKCPEHGIVTVSHETLDEHAPVLEAALTGGGVAQAHFDLRELAGVEVLAGEDIPTGCMGREKCEALASAVMSDMDCHPAFVKSMAKAELPEELFDGNAVYMRVCANRADGNSFTSPENVSAVLDAVMQLIREREARS